jgi:predicted nucleotidyltransferase
METVATSPWEQGIRRLEEARGVARAFAADARAHFGPRLRDLRLFGSAARGDWQETSDVDVLVLLDRVGIEDRDWISSRAAQRGVLSSGIPLSTVTLAEDDLRHLRQRERLFAREVDREGQAL